MISSRAIPLQIAPIHRFLFRNQMLTTLQKIVLNGGPGDARMARWELFSALSLWSCLLLLVAAIVTARSAGVSLFLSHYGGRELALVYVVVGIAVVSFIYGLSWITHGVQYDRVAVATVLGLGLGTATFRLVLPPVHSGNTWMYGAMYIFLETFALVTSMQVWTLANSLFSSDQARRLYVFIATGGIFGSMLGGLVIRFGNMLPTADLLWVVVGLCPAMVVAIRIFKRYARRLRQFVVKVPGIQARVGTVQPDGTEPMVRWIRHPVLRRRSVFWLVVRLALLAFLGAFTTNLVDFYFKTYADRQFHGDTAKLTRFFGSFYLSVGCMSLAMQLVVTPVIVRRASVFAGLAITPAMLSAVTLTNLFGASLFRATLLKLVDSSFAHSVQRSCTEMLYTPLPPNLTGEIKLISEGAAGRAGLVVSGLVLWLLAPVLNTERTLVLVASLLVCWFGALMAVRQAYRASVTPPMRAPAKIWKRAA